MSRKRQLDGIEPKGLDLWQEKAEEEAPKFSHPKETTACSQKFGIFGTTEYPSWIFCFAVYLPLLHCFEYNQPRCPGTAMKLQMWWDPATWSNGHSRLGTFWGVVHCGPIWEWAQTLWIISSALHRKAKCISGPIGWWYDPFISGSKWQTWLSRKVPFLTLPGKQFNLFCLYYYFKFFSTSEVALLEQELFFKAVPLLQSAAHQL